MDGREPRELVGDVERLLEQLETLPDTVVRQSALEAVQSLLELYGEGLARIVDQIAVRDDGSLARALVDDELVEHLLLLHGLHPVSIDDRVAGALAGVRPYLESHGGDVELLAVQDGVVRLRLEGSCSGCPSSTMTLKLAIENAISKAAPEIEEVIAQEHEGAPANGSPLLQIELAGGLQGEAPLAAPPPVGDWTMAGGLPELSGGGSVLKQVGGQSILFLRLETGCYAYQPSCPYCGESLAQSSLHGVELTCSGCASRYDVMRAGRCLDSPQLHLEPVPLLEGEDGLVKVALPSPV